jgi:hypothetical protein
MPWLLLHLRRRKDVLECLLLLPPLVQQCCSALLWFPTAPAISVPHLPTDHPRWLAGLYYIHYSPAVM